MITLRTVNKRQDQTYHDGIFHDPVKLKTVSQPCKNKFLNRNQNKISKPLNQALVQASIHTKTSKQLWLSLWSFSHTATAECLLTNTHPEREYIGIADWVIKLGTVIRETKQGQDTYLPTSQMKTASVLSSQSCCLTNWSFHIFRKNKKTLPLK